MDALTPYDAAKIVETLAADGRCAKVTPQTMYGYAKSGRISSNYASYKSGDADKVYFDGDAFAKWLKDYLSGKIATRSKKNYAELAELYAS